MRWCWLIGVLALLGGCSQAPPTLAHGKPVAHWVELLRHPDALERKKAVQVLGNVGTADPEVLPALTGAVKDRNAGVRAEAVAGLLKMGPAAESATSVLQDAAKDRDARVRTYAARALARIGGAP
jgi:HEAT repeat protein